jgi:MFS family permease
MRIQRNLRLIDAYTIGMNMIFMLPVLIPYYRDEIGIGFREFLLGEAAFSATVILLDVPTGWLSDMWQRKHTQALGFFFLLLGYGCLAIAHSFFMAVLAQSIIGVGISLCNGTTTAILYDSLLSVNREDEYRKREGRRQAICFYTTAPAGILGALVYSFNHHAPLLMMMGSLLIALISTCLLDEPERHKRKPERHPVMDILATIKYALHGHKEVAFIILFAAAMFCSTKLIMWTQQPYYMALKIPEAWYGALMAVSFMLGGAASHVSHLLDGKIDPYRMLALLWAFALVICLGAAWSPGWHGVALLMMGGTCIYGMASPRVNEVINRHVDSSRRATVLSTQTLMISLLFIPLSTVLGYLSKHWGIQAVLLGIAVWLCAAGIMLALVAAKRKR